MLNKIQVVRGAGLEPASRLRPEILSLLCIPIPSSAHSLEAPTGFEPVYAVLQTAA